MSDEVDPELDHWSIYIASQMGLRDALRSIIESNTYKGRMEGEARGQRYERAEMRDKLTYARERGTACPLCRRKLKKVKKRK